MDRKIHFGAIFGTSILLTLTVIGFRRQPLPQPARNGSADVARASNQHVLETYGKLPLTFEANVGQTSSQVKFVSRGQGYTLFLTRYAEAVLVLRKSAPERTPSQPADKLSAVVKPQPEAGPSAIVRMKLVGAKRTPQVEGFEELPGKANYFIGNDPKKWRTNVPTYRNVRYREVYPGVDLVYYGNQRQLEHDFVVAPGADPSSIMFSFAGAEKMSLDPRRGALVLSGKGGEVRFEKPRLYQELGGMRREISGGYVLKNANCVGFEVAAYDANQPLIIDPTLVYSTYLGGSSDDLGFGIAVDAGGNAYVTGYTSSTDFPTTPGAFQSANAAFYNAFVTKLNPASSPLVGGYSTYLGGSGNSFGKGIAVDAAGNAYVTGYTFSTDFPTTAGAFQSANAGGVDAFVTMLNPAGSPLVGGYSTYLGGSSFDTGLGIAVDAAGNAYVTGETNSTNFPTTPGAFQTAFHGGFTDAFVTKLNPAGSPLVGGYSTYLGGSSDDGGQGIAVDAGGNAYVAGFTASTDFPTTAGAFQSANAGGNDAFVTKLNPAGSPLVGGYSTYLGGSSDDFGLGIAVDAGGNAYVAGFTRSTDFPTTAGAFQSANAGGYDAFVTKLNPAGSPLVGGYSTYLGGSSDDLGFGIGADAGGNAYVAGYTRSTDFPTTPGAFQSANAGGYDAFVTKISNLTSPPKDQPIQGHGLTFSATEGQSFSGMVATVTDGDPADKAAEYSATIDWGDGTSITPGAVTGPDGGPYDVNGTHMYAEEGTYPVRVHVTDSDSTNTADATSTANVADAALTSKCAAPPFIPQMYVGPTATFNDSSSTGTPSDFSATINWGDGTSTGAIVGGPGLAPYTVNGNHTYSTTGTFTITTTINDVGGSKTTAACPVTVFGFPTATGSFVIGDLTDHFPTPGSSVTWWSSQWAKLNPMSGGPAPASMKGFAGFEDNLLGTSRTCGSSWTTDTGNATPPPPSVPQYMGVLVSSMITQNGSVISGNIKRVAVVRNNPGYAPNPGNPGTGTIVAWVCGP